MRQIFINTRDDMKWLLEIHLKNKVLIWKPKSAILHGHHEDSPDTIKLFRMRSPLITDIPYQIIRMEDQDGNASD